MCISIDICLLLPWSTGKKVNNWKIIIGVTQETIYTGHVLGDLCTSHARDNYIYRPCLGDLCTSHARDNYIYRPCSGRSVYFPRKRQLHIQAMFWAICVLPTQETITYTGHVLGDLCTSHTRDNYIYRRSVYFPGGLATTVHVNVRLSSHVVSHNYVISTTEYISNARWLVVSVEAG